MTHTNTPAAFINMLLKKHGVPLETVVACTKEHLGKLEQMKDIYALKNSNDAELLLTLPQLLIVSEETASQIIECFKNEEPENPFLAAAQPNLEKYKVLLLSAFVYNPSFFSMAWNWCAYVQDKVRKGQAKPKLELVKPETNTINPDGRMIWELNRRIDRKVAASAGNRQFGEATHLEGIGDLYQFAEEAGESLYFQFGLSITNEQLSRPFVLEIEFTTVKDGKPHQISIEDTDEREQSIRSMPVDDVDASLGIEIHRAAFRPR